MLQPYARGLKLDVDYANMAVTLNTQYLPWNKTYSESQGSVQLQPNGNVLVGWGQTPCESLRPSRSVPALLSGH